VAPSGNDCNAIADLRKRQQCFWYCALEHDVRSCLPKLTGRFEGISMDEAGRQHQERFGNKILEANGLAPSRDPGSG